MKTLCSLLMVVHAFFAAHCHAAAQHARAHFDVAPSPPPSQEQGVTKKN